MGVVNNKDIIGTVGRARISSKFYKCGSFDGMGEWERFFHTSPIPKGDLCSSLLSPTQSGL
jgi:hypothetical protein